MVNKELFLAIDELSKEKGIPKGILMDKIQAAIATAYKKELGAGDNLVVEMNSDKNEVKVYAEMSVVETVENPLLEIDLDEAHTHAKKYNVGDVVRVEKKVKDFSRLAAHAAKNVITQGIREAERGIIYQEFQSRENEILSGIVSRVEPNNICIEINKTPVYLMASEQIPGERFSVGDHVKVYVVEVKEAPKGPLVKISRTHPGLVKRLFEIEVPEIQDGSVIIKSIAREAGSRTKIAVYTEDENIDPIGSCIGPKGARVASIVAELKGEKIDIVRYYDDIGDYVAQALSPANVVNVFVSPDEKSCRAVVPDNQLSLAIGKEGQNARLAAKLTGWKIDIKPESEAYTNL